MVSGGIEGDLSNMGKYLECLRWWRQFDHFGGRSLTSSSSPSTPPSIQPSEKFPNQLCSLDQFRENYSILTATDIKRQEILINERKFIKLYEKIHDRNKVNPLLLITFCSCDVSIITDRNVVPYFEGKIEISVFKGINEVVSLGNF